VQLKNLEEGKRLGETFLEKGFLPNPHPKTFIYTAISKGNSREAIIIEWRFESKLSRGIVLR
jgi:hypothetical protein